MKHFIQKLASLFLFMNLFLIYSHAINIDSLQNSLTSELSRDNYKRLIILTDYYYTDNFDTAYLFVEKAQKIAKFLNNDEMIADAYKYQALCYVYNNKRDKAIEIFNKELDIRSKLEDINGKAAVYINLGDSKYDLGQLDSSLSNYMQALEFYRQTMSDSGQIIALRSIAFVQSDFSNFDLALEYNLRALNIAENSNYEKETGNLLNNIGSIYRKLSKYDLALDYYKRSLSIRESINDSIGVGGSYSNIGDMFDAKNNLDSAIAYYNIAIKINRLTKKWNYLAVSLSNLSYTYLKVGKEKLALENAYQGLEINESHGYLKGTISTLNMIGVIYSRIGNVDKAIEYYNKSKGAAIKADIKANIARAYYGLYNLYLSIDDYKSAFTNYQIFILYKDSLFTERMNVSFEKVQAKYKTEKTNAENQALRIEQEKDKNAKTILYIVSVFLIIIVFLLIYIILSRAKISKRNKQYYEKEKQLNLTLKQKSETEKKRFDELIYAEKKINELQKEKISNKNREMSTVVRSIYSKNKILDKLSKQIDDIENSKQFDIQSLKKLKQLITGKQMLEEDWNVLRNQIEEVYHGFFDKLSKKYPLLTEHDQKLCSYLLIDMSSKEIARIMNVTDAAVIKSKQRLRKKVNIESNEQFIKFLRQI